MSINDMHTFSHLSSRGPELPARNSLFIRSLLCTLLVACPAMAEPVTGLDDIKLGRSSTAACGEAGAALRAGRPGRNLARDEEDGPGTAPIRLRPTCS